MRGKLAAVIKELGTVGLIPAYAGKTPMETTPVESSQAHPRVCGENLDCFASKRFIWGSSPRMRGKRKLLLCKLLDQGLIPAYAGKTFVNSIAVDW